MQRCSQCILQPQPTGQFLLGVSQETDHFFFLMFLFFFVDFLSFRSRGRSLFLSSLRSTFVLRDILFVSFLLFLELCSFYIFFLSLFSFVISLHFHFFLKYFLVFVGVLFFFSFAEA